MVKSRKSVRAVIGRMIAAVFLILVAILMISPIAAVIFFSVRDGIKPYIDFFVWKPELLYSLSNSIIIATASSLGTVLISVPAGFIFSKQPFPGSKVIFYLYVVMMVIPFQAIMLPQYQLLKNLHLYDTLSAVIIPAIFTPFGVFLLTQSIESIDNEVFEAAYLETSSMCTMIWKILLPGIRLPVLCLWVISFCENWNLVSEPLAFIDTVENFPISIRFHAITENDAFAFAAAVVFMLLPLLIFRAFDDEIVEGLGEYRLK